MNQTVETFRINVGQEIIEDLKIRLERSVRSSHLFAVVIPTPSTRT